MQGYLKCKKVFPGGIGEKSYGGFNLNSCKKNTTEEHREQINEIMACSTAQAQN